MDKEKYLKKIDKKWKKQTKRFFKTVLENVTSAKTFEVEILIHCCSCLDQFLIAKKEIRKNGMTITSKNGYIRINPIINVQKIAFQQFLQGIKLLGISSTIAKKVGRPLSGD